MTGPWAAAELDPERVAAELARRFPGVPVWRGEFTGRWWAVVRDRAGHDRLLEAADPAVLARSLEESAAAVLPARRNVRPSSPPISSMTVPQPRAPVHSRRAGGERRAARHVRRGRGGWFRSVVGALVAS
ncbi:hypothetical protein [Actinomadura meyerae]|uniref:hypothetical protein n=1 Tax=Actinomadura meyerae TaxID=240840 RepID=UPI0011786C96|nr:hypothetical protein [Actinomadura meyerae]